MHRTKILISMIVVTALAVGAVAAEQAAPAKPAEPSAELKVLYRFVGNWRGETKVHETRWTPREIRGTNTTSCTPVLGGRFTLNRTRTSNGESSLTLATYDVHRKVYRLWWFSSTGEPGEWQGKWDAETKTMTWRSEDDDGVTSVAKSWYVDDDTAKWTVVAKDRDGQTRFSMEAKETRVKTLPKGKDAPAGEAPKRSAEQKVIDLFLGEWKGTSTALKAAWHPKETRATDTSSCVSILGGRFTESRGKVSDGTTSLVLTTYDRRKKCYRMWYFNSTGITSESRGQWDAETKALTLTVVNDPDSGVTGTGTVRVVDKGEIEWTWVIKAPDGSVGFHMKGKNTRVKKPAKTKSD